MKLLFDSFWRAVAYCLRPKVIVLSLLPLLVAGALELVWAKLFWEDSVRITRDFLVGIPGVQDLVRWLATHVSDAFPVVAYALVVILIATPVFVALVLLLAALWVSPAAVSVVSSRRFHALERRHGGSWWKGFLLSLWHTLAALLLSVVTLPLWLIPPLGLVLPTIIWGRMTAKVMSFDALAEHATVGERRAILAAHAWPLLVMGMGTGLLCSTTSLFWIISIGAVMVFPFTMVFVLWVYTMIFTFSALWFTHYLLSALAQLRAAESAMQSVQPSMPAVAPLPLVEEVPVHERFAAGDAGDDASNAI